MIYLDNAATTFPKPEPVYAAMDQCARGAAVNAGRGNYRLAREAAKTVKNVKRDLLSLCNARGLAEVIFTPSATVAINQIVQGYVWKKGDVAYVSPYEHNAVTRSLYLMKNRFGIELREMPLKKDLSVDLELLGRMFQKDPPAFVAVTGVSNVTGYILPAGEIFKMAKQYQAFTLLDASQAMGILEFYFGHLCADALVFAGHKTLYGPMGISGFLLKNGVVLRDVIVGGNGQNSLSLQMPLYAPEKYESGSMNTVALAGLAAALEWLEDTEVAEKEQALIELLIGELEKMPEIILYRAPDPEHQAGIVSFNIKGFRANEAAAILDYERDIAVRAGHHCAALIHKYLRDDIYEGAIRVSVGYFTSEKDILDLVDGLKMLNRKSLANIPDDVLRGMC